jgi:hypothetical protein
MAARVSCTRGTHQEQSATMAPGLRIRTKHARRPVVRIWCTAVDQDLPDHAIGRDPEPRAGAGGGPDRS